MKTTRTRIRGRWLLGFLLVLALIATACSGDSDSESQLDSERTSSDSPAAPDEASTDDADGETGTEASRHENLADVQEATLALSNVPSSVDPMVVLGGSPRRFDLYEALFDLEPQTAEVLPMLATEWERVDDTTLSVTLREDAMFHNGDPLTSADVEFSMARASREENPLATASLMDTYAGINVIDDYHFELLTSGPDAIFEKKMARIAILPKNYYEGLGETDDARDEAFASAPIGSGPYRLESYDPSRVVVVKADTTWRDPILDKVTVLGVTDPSAQVASFLSGESQFVNLLPLDSLDQIEEAGGELLVYQKGNSLGAFMDTLDTNGDAKEGPMGSRDVRQALNYAVDKDTLVNDVLGGLTQTSGGQHAPRGTDFYDEEIEDYPYDPALAEKMLDEAGFPRDGDGNRFSISMASAFAGPGSARRLIGEYVVAQLADVGVNVEYEALTDVGLATDMFYNRSPRPDIYHFGLFTRPYLDPVGAYNWFQTSNEAKHYSNPEFDELYEQQQSETDQEARKKILFQMAEIIHDDAPWLFLTMDTWIDAAGPTLKGAIVSEVQTEQYYDTLFRVDA